MPFVIINGDPVVFNAIKFLVNKLIENNKKIDVCNLILRSLILFNKKKNQKKLYTKL